MAYRINLNLNCADRVRFAQAAKDTGLDEADLILELVKGFFASRGVKNPLQSSKSLRKINAAHRV